MVETRSRSIQFESGQNKQPAVMEFSLDGDILHANEAFLRALGYVASEIRGKHHRVLIDPSDLTKAYSIFWEHLRAGNARTASFRMLSRGGKPLRMRCLFQPVKDQFGRAYKVRQYVTEIYARNEEAELEPPAPEIEVSETDVLMAEIDLNGKILYANESYCALMRYELAELVGAPHTLLVGAADARGPEYLRLWEELRQGRPVSGRFQRLTKYGQPVVIEGWFSPVFSHDGTPFKAIVHGRYTGAHSLSASRMTCLRDLENCLEVVQSALAAEVKNGLVSSITGEAEAEANLALDPSVSRLTEIVNELKCLIACRQSPPAMGGCVETGLEPLNIHAVNSNVARMRT